MQFKIDFRDGTENSLKKEYALFLFDEIKNDIYEQVSKYKEKYNMRLDYINNYFEQKLTFEDIRDIVVNSIELVTIKGDYFIRLGRSSRSTVGSLTSSVLVRVLEYGIPGYLRELPVLRKIFRLYQNDYQSLYVQFMERKFGIS